MTFSLSTANQSMAHGLLSTRSRVVQISGATSESLAPPGGFKVGGSNGYTVKVLSGTSQDQDHGWIILEALRKRQGVIYEAPAQVTSTSIVANLGALGEIAMTFEPRDAPQTWLSNCGDKVTTEAGTYTGVFRFVGENGYTTAEASTAVPELLEFLNLICPGAEGVTGFPSLPGAELDVRNTSTADSVQLMVVKNHLRGPVHVDVSVTERRGEISIRRFANVIAGPGAFSYGSRLSLATVSLPKPFTGMATYRRRGNAVRHWTGNLAVGFPGRKRLALTGRRFAVSLKRAFWKWMS